MPFNLGPWEILVIVGAALLFLGPEKLPQLASKLGASLREFRKATTGFKSAIDAEMYNETPPQPPETPPADAKALPKTEPGTEPGTEPEKEKLVPKPAEGTVEHGVEPPLVESEPEPAETPSKNDDRET